MKRFPLLHLRESVSQLRAESTRWLTALLPASAPTCEEQRAALMKKQASIFRQSLTMRSLSGMTVMGALLMTSSCHSTRQHSALRDSCAPVITDCCAPVVTGCEAPAELPCFAYVPPQQFTAPQEPVALSAIVPPKPETKPEIFEPAIHEQEQAAPLMMSAPPMAARMMAAPMPEPVSEPVEIKTEPVSLPVEEEPVFEAPMQMRAFQAAMPAPEPAGVITLAPITHEVEQRVVLENCPPPELPCPPIVQRGFSADEYVCDGGDKKLPVHYMGYRREGLDTEDTIGEYVDHEGKQHLKVSSRVCVYAPRFASVRSASLPQEGVRIDRAAGHQDIRRTEGYLAKVVIDEKIQSDEAIGIEMRSRPSGLRTREAEASLLDAQRVSNHVKLTNVYEEYRFIGEGQFEQTYVAVTGLTIAAAQEWAEGKRAVIIAQDQAGHIFQARAKAEEYVGIEDRRKAGELSITKSADKAAAHPGEIVTFSIHFENAGDRELHKIRIVDNLSPRLTFVEGSIRSDRDGDFRVEDNGAGGSLLTFEFDAPLEGKTKGVIHFETRVR